MFLTRSEYDRGVNTFSPELGSTTVGITTPYGVVLGVEKRVQSPLLESSSIEKIMEIDRHIGCAMSGLTADARTMVDHARVTSQMHQFTYDEEIGVESCTQYHTDPSGTFVRYEAKAIGSGSDAAQQSLQDSYHKEAYSLALKVLKQVMEEKLDETNVQLAQVTGEKGFEILGVEPLRTAIESITA
ncbi:proteasome subunit alpha type 5 [Trichosporon asahii var. asahii CBS 8904]|uniref:Proteasome subunit alpha type 5 n=1 Tax=Trichosporon asahii var. asahii (strain CBS 8904) TaxID=1220162 RepID=K1VD34_TRIAC|nr:proteasome subunit alpha type 5 [Trichosporon asahii var. asahii CBS 8904]